ncbi:hypothetical protein G5V57_23430 [Nordella sp. HKS 07]|uniref:hypothetical protein n=1 Tax=Nordella sp. HKS 07 TaxID=2712222 RepID=UPI0013E0F30C|nr:hypothetical protein [Nordella sp. HKS 07]QIG50422.1 hypothetical protein G5V57_23430 [Nordella sp. HKS 07]
MGKILVAALCALAICGGAANAEEWLDECKVDPMNDDNDCIIYNRDVDLMIGIVDRHSTNESSLIELFAPARGPTLLGVCLILHNYPGRKGLIRIDAHKAIETDERGCLPTKLILPQMKAGNRVRTRYWVFPNDKPIEREGSLIGLTSAIDQLTNRLKKP